MPIGNQRLIIAVGSPSQWQSSLPLPPEAVTVDLIPAALNEPETAREFWGAFLSYLILSAKPSAWRRFLMFIVPRTVSVEIELQGDLAKQAVRDAIKASLFGTRFRML